MSKDNNKTRHNFLKTFFDIQEEYQVKEVNGFILVQQWNGNTKEWQVAIYDKENWAKAKDWQDRFKEPNLSWIK